MRENDAVDRVLGALRHPVRRRILGELANGPSSASTIARTFRMDLGVVSYHLNKVLAQQCKVVELVDAVPRRGSVEKFYELVGDPQLDLPVAGEPGSCEEMSWTIAMAQGLFKALEEAQARG